MKIFFGVIVGITFFLIGCGSNVANNPPEKVQQSEPSVPEITSAEAKSMLNKLSKGLDVHYDDMLEKTYYSCQPPDEHPLYFIPYVVVDNRFNVNLGLQIFNISRYPLFFDKLYIKSENKLYTFDLGSRASSYNELMEHGIYQSLKEAIDDGYLKFRVTGNDIGERELTAEELAQIDEVFAIYEYFSKVKVMN